MVTEARRGREKLLMRHNILQAARAIAATEGWPNVTIRKIADAIEYSAPLIYKYFESKEAILDELIAEGYGILTAQASQAPQPGDSPRQALLRIAPTFCRFAEQFPERYRVMNGLDGVPCRFNEPVENSELFQITRPRLQAAAAAAGVSIANLDAAIYMMWGTIHGLITLALSNQISGGWPQTTALVQQACESLLNGWGVIKPAD